MAKDDRKGILIGKYEVGRQLGQGTFAKVYHGRHVQSGKSVALKVVAKDKVIKAGMTEQLEREISVMKMVRHPNVVQLHEVLATKNKIYFVMELVRGGELFSIIQKQGKLNEHDARHYFHQLISAVDFCHSRKVYHRDLKPENLLVDERNILKITDFGLSALSDHIGQDGLLHTICGTPAYVAPEVVGRNGYDGEKADIWSCGVILYVLLAGFLPFRDDNIVAMYRKIYCGDFKCPPWFSTGARKLIIQMLDPEPDTRISISEIMGSSWFNKEVVTKNVEAAVVDDEETETFNAFHLISLSEGFDLSPLFEDKKRGDGGHKGEMRFATTRPVNCVVSKLEAVAKSVKFGIKRGDFGVRLLGVENGRKGKLGILVEMFVVAPSSLLVVEVKKSSGDTLEYNDFCRKELRPALKDIVWASASTDD